MLSFSKRLSLLFFITLLIFSCSSDEGGIGSLEDEFYSGAIRNLDKNLLNRYWSISDVVFEGETFPVPQGFVNCGRDFFIFNEEGIYLEYIFNSSDCDFTSQQLNWTENNGIIALRNNLGQTDEMVVTTLNSSRLSFKVQLDVDEDGIADIVTINANSYQPTDFDRYSSTFFSVFENPQLDIKFEWLAYDGFVGFDRYEIYRNDTNCDKTNAQLIATISEATTNTFIDPSPAASDELCYFLRIYNQNGLLGESDLVGFSPAQLDVAAVNQYEPVVNGESITLNWDAYTANYFDRYEITVSNQEVGITGYGDQEYVIATIDDVAVNSFTIDSFPFIENPTYTIYAYTIFEKRSFAEIGNVTSGWTVPIKRDEILDLGSVESFAISSTEPVVYLYGHNNNTYAIHRFNYETNETEAISDKALETSTSAPLKVISSNNGTEVLIEQGSELFFFTENLTFKYSVTSATLPSYDDYAYLGNNIWAFVANNRVYTISRNNNEFTEIAQQTLYASAPTYTGYRMMKVDEGVLIGHHEMTSSVLVDVDTNGQLLNTSEIDLAFTSDFLEPAIFNESQQILVNPFSNTIYSTQGNVQVGQFQFPQFPTGLSTDASQVWGSNNDPSWSIDTESAHLKEIVVYNRSTEVFNSFSTIGYSHAVFENHLGETYSISSGFKRERLRGQINERKDIFLERVSN